MNDIFQYAMFVVIAGAVLAAALVCAGAGLFLLHASRKRSSRFFTPLLGLVAVMGTTSVALSGRILQNELGAAISEASLMDVESGLPAKLLLGLLAGLAFVTLVGRIFQSQRRMNFPFALASTFVAFYVTLNLVPAAFGYYPMFQYSLIYTPMIVMALFVSVPEKPHTTVRAVKAALLLVVVPSLIAAVVAPTLTLQASAKALIPGYGMRLWGLTSHANVLGAVALTLCLIEWSFPYRGAAWHRLCLLSGVMALLWTQSKTSIAAALVAILVIVMYQTILALKEMNARPKARPGRRRWLPMIAVSLGMIMTLLLLIAVVFGEDIGLFSSITRRLANFNLNTFQGRTLIWQQAINEGLKHPFFGYGLTLWSQEYRLATGLTSAFHAHNQFLQVFSVAGVFGLLGFTAYLLVLGKISIAVARDSQGVSLALFVVLLVRSLSEVPIQFGFSGEFLPHLAFVIFIGSLYGRDKQIPSAITGESPTHIRPQPWVESNAREY